MNERQKQFNAMVSRMWLNRITPKAIAAMRRISPSAAHQKNVDAIEERARASRRMERIEQESQRRSDDTE